jgi:hypothetical protein
LDSVHFAVLAFVAPSLSFFERMNGQCGEGKEGKRDDAGGNGTLWEWGIIEGERPAAVAEVQRPAPALGAAQFAIAGLLVTRSSLPLGVGHYCWTSEEISWSSCAVMVKGRQNQW